MIKKIFYTPIPSWFLIVFILVVGISLGVFLTYFGEVVYNYKLLIPAGDGKILNFEYGAWPALQNVKFFNDVKKKFIAEKVDFIEGDLSAMVLRVYKAGMVQKEVKILSKGKEGSWWETPAGIYKIEGKEKKHFSSFGKVYMPWSMPFQGNFFIHGWPYYPGGEPVPEGYSGGCIRLETADAKAVYNLVQVGTPVLVFDKDFSDDSFKYEFRAPKVSAKAYLAADLRNNFVFLRGQDEGIRPIASVTKLVTAVVATEYINLEKKVVVEKEDLVATSKPRLWAGQEISIYNLLFPLLLESSNEAAAVLSRTLGETRFTNLMNDKAVALGMQNTKFVDASGSSAGNTSTLEDLFVLAKYLYNNRSFILRISSGGLADSVYGPSTFTDLENFNVFGGNPSFRGGKIGKTTAAGETILSIFDLNVNGQKRPIAIVVLDSENVGADAAEILNYVRTNYAGE